MIGTFWNASMVLGENTDLHLTFGCTIKWSTWWRVWFGLIQIMCVTAHEVVRRASSDLPFTITIINEMVAFQGQQKKNLPSYLALNSFFQIFAWGRLWMLLSLLFFWSWSVNWKQKANQVGDGCYILVAGWGQKYKDMSPHPWHSYFLSVCI